VRKLPVHRAARVLRRTRQGDNGSRWDEAKVPADTIGLAEQWHSGWLVWLGTFAHNDELPGEPDLTGRE
jgi:hypothetical protein